MKKHSLIIFLAALLGLASCKGYNSALKSDNYAEKFEMANTLFEGGDEVRSIALYEQIYQRMPKTGEGELAYFRIGKAYYVGEDYYMAGYYLGMFSRRFPSSPKAEETLFLSAMCSVKNSPGVSLDQNETELAINDLQQFVNRYPNSILIDSCNVTIDRLRFKLETKDFEAVKLYAKTENYRAAVSSAMTFMGDYPASIFKEDAYFILVKNSYLLSKNSIESKILERIDQTMERYRTFVAEFPESKYATQVANYNDLAAKDKEDYLKK
ncbi:MAG: outer membrane protein assembly factor BamD [Crocinitomicaceae bacterium]|nr:outer membrane protein assembly factor BamD [Crocinitomicaceae bacterium]